ncbi:sensor histidine kinase [Tenacibaculum finnmarkense]|uniref:sensor histidine kinase n=1 Tax=Tenacibaculum finnmarkense TaxID=2781243 RepID=UPI003BB61820
MKLLQSLLLFVFLFITKTVIPQQNNLKNYTLKSGLPSLKITDITQDNNGYLWFSSSKGIIRFDGNKFKTYTRKNGLISNNTTVISAQKKAVFIGTNKGFCSVINGKFKQFESDRINCIVTSPSQTFLGTNKGILRLRKDFLSNIRTNFQIDLNKINDLKFDGKFYWIATNKALWKLDKIINPTVLKRIELGNYTAILINKKRIIATTYNHGIKLIINTKVKTISTALKNITGIKYINKQFWIVSEDQGIEILDSNFNFIKSINKYNTLKTNQIQTVFQDQEKNIWIATNNHGIYRLKSKNIVRKKPVITFQNIEIVYQTLDSININEYPKILSLKPSKNHVSFTYKSVNINTPGNILYRYKLNRGFSKWSGKNTVDFPYLTPGNYTFTAQSKIGKIKSKPIHFQFFIDTPIHQKKWFQWLISTLISLLLLGRILFYIKKIKVKNKTKIEKLQAENHLLSLEQKALQLQMNPHFIFNVLNGIKALGNAGKTTELNNTISKFAILLRAVLNNSRQEEINLADEISILKNYISLEQQINATSFEYEINTDINLDAEEILIPPMLIQPFVENCIKHAFKASKSNKISIIFSTKNQFLECNIIDNGIGIQQSKLQIKSSSHNSVAIKITEERIKTLSKKSAFSIAEISKNKAIIGTKIFFKIPLKTDF